jgi:hypothetical protein
VDTATTTCGGAAPGKKRAAAARLTTRYITSTPFSGCSASRRRSWQ